MTKIQSTERGHIQYHKQNCTHFVIYIQSGAVWVIKLSNYNCQNETRSYYRLVVLVDIQVWLLCNSCFVFSISFKIQSRPCETQMMMTLKEKLSMQKIECSPSVGERLQRAEVRISEMHTQGCAGDIELQVWEHQSEREKKKKKKKGGKKEEERT